MDAQYTRHRLLEAVNALEDAKSALANIVTHDSWNETDDSSPLGDGIGRAIDHIDTALGDLDTQRHRMPR